MKNRKRVAAWAVLLLFAVVAVFWSLKRSPAPAEKPAIATATAPAPAPAPPPPPVAKEEPASEPAAASAPAETETKPASSRQRIVRASSRAAAEQKTAPAEPARDEEETNKAAAQFQPEPTPAASAPPAPKPAPPPEPTPSVAVAGLFQNRVGASFSLLRVTVTIDGKRVYSGAGGKSLELFRTTVPPGNHNVSVHAEYRATSAGGVFSYAEGYRFGVQGGRRFTTTEGRPLQITMTGFERGGPTTAFEDRLALAVNTR